MENNKVENLDHQQNTRNNANDQAFESQSKKLLDICSEVKLFHTPEDEAFATVRVNGHQETYAVKSSGFKRWILYEFYKRFKSAPNERSISDALSVLLSRASFDSPKQDVFIRIGAIDKAVYIDLGSDDWEVVEVTASGWRVLKDSPVRFRRSKCMLALPNPVPVAGIEINSLKEFLNVESDDDFKLIVAWILNAFNPSGPYLSLVLYGEQGSAKSSTVKVLRGLTDPSTAPLRQPFKSSDDLMVSAKSNWPTYALDAS